MSTMGHDYFHVVMDRFRETCVLMLCKNQITSEKTTHLFFQHVWVHFGLPISIILDREIQFLGNFMWRMMETKLKRRIYFHPQTNDPIEVASKAMVQLLQGYHNKHTNSWDD